MKKAFLAIALIFFVVFAIDSAFIGFSFAQNKFYPGKVYVTQEDGSLKEVTNPKEIEELYMKVKSKECSLTILGSKNDVPRMDRFRQNGYAHRLKPSDKAVYIISCGEGWCRTIGGVQKCCPPTCY